MIYSLNSLKLLMGVALFVAVVTGCDKKDNPSTPTPTPSVVNKPNQIFFGVNLSNQLIRFNANAVETAGATVSITGLQSGENILGIDFRPATGELYGVTNRSRLYIINTTTGATRAVGNAAFTPAINGSAVAFDFNPTVDRIRLISSEGQNLRLNPETGTVAATDGTINGASGAYVTEAAYTGNTAGSTNTTLYDIDLASGKLFRQVPPNNGTLVEIGSLGLGTILGSGGFDISPNGAVALATLTVGRQNNLYQIDTASGRATLLGTFADVNSLVAIAIPTNPVAYAVDDMNNLLIFDATATSSPSIITKPITGMAAGETVLGIDMRPLNGQLYAIGSTSRLYTINASSGAATAVGAGPFATPLSGTSFGFDFNPTVDRIRLVSNTGQNLRLHPDLGTIAATDGAINPGIPSLSAAGYTNNFAGATTTMLFVIDHATDKMYLQNPPNNGTLVETGSLGVNIEAANGFDIGSTSGRAFSIFTVGGAQGIYSINLSNGNATKTADFSRSVRGLALGLGF